MRKGFLPTLIVTAAVLVAAGCSDKRNAAHRSVPEQTFATWDAFLSDGQATRERRKVVFIGLDGATWEIIDPLIAKGVLPNFARLKREGSWGTLRSTETYVSPPAWTTMMTGFLPERTGIYSFGHWDPDQQRFLPLRSSDVLVPTIWDIASLGGARTAVVNVPVTYPVRDVNGIMVSGLLTPSRLADRGAFEFRVSPAQHPETTGAPRSYSPLLLGRIDNGANQFDVYLVDSQDDGDTRYDQVHLEVTNTVSDQPAVYRFAAAALSPWLKIDVQTNDELKHGWIRAWLLRGDQPTQYYLRCSHTLWSSADTDVQFTFPRELADDIHKVFDAYFPSTYLDGVMVPGHTELATRYATFFLDYDDWDLFQFVFTQTDNVLHDVGVTAVTENVFEIIDKFLGDLIDKLTDNYTLVIASDHGFMEYEQAIDINRLFEAIGLATYKDDRNLDYDKTLAFHNMWAIFYNDALLTQGELRSRGVDCPDGAEPREALTRFIRSEPKRYLAQSLGQDVPLEFTEVPAGAAGLPPDLLITGSYEHHQIELWNINKPRPEIVSHLEGGARWYHTRRGMLAMRGPDIREGVHVEPTDIQNITPTLLYLLGLPGPTNIDGRIITEAFEPAALASRPRFIISDFAALPKKLDVSDQRREDIEKQLRSLGYIR